MVFQLCDKPPLMRELAYRFSYHFCNGRIGSRLFMDFFYRGEPNDIHGWSLMRYGVDSVMCSRLVDRPLLRLHVVLHGDVLLDSLAFLNCDNVDTAQLVCRSWRRSIDANSGVLPLQQFAEVQVEAVAPELCRVIFGLSSAGFTFQRHVSLDDLSLALHTALKRSRVGLLVLKGDIDEYVGFRFLDAMNESVIIEKLRLDFRCRYKADALTALCKKAVDDWRTTALGLYNPQHTQRIFGDAEITRKLTRLEISVPTIDCRPELDALLFGNPHLDTRLQFIYGNLSYRRGVPRQYEYPTCMEESFFRHYFESVFRRISDAERDCDFVRVLFIRSVFALIPPFGGSGFLRARAIDPVTGERKAVEDDGMKFLVFEAGSDSRRYQVFWGEQLFYGDGAPSQLDYYVLTATDLQHSGQTQQHGLRFADWLIRLGEAGWEQLHAAKDWMRRRGKATRFAWFHLAHL